MFTYKAPSLQDDQTFKWQTVAVGSTIGYVYSGIKGAVRPLLSPNIYLFHSKQLVEVFVNFFHKIKKFKFLIVPAVNAVIPE